jgi:hypothetical protein
MPPCQAVDVLVVRHAEQTPLSNDGVIAVDDYPFAMKPLDSRSLW